MQLCFKIHNARFRNKAVTCAVQAKHVQSQHQMDLADMQQCPSAVQAKHVQSQHQVDLADMQQCPIEWKGKLHKYILSLMDTFSRYH